MAGQPKKRAMIMELERRTREEFAGDAEERTVLDYIEVWLNSGRFLSELAEEISDEIGYTISRGSLSSWVNSQPGAEARLAAARSKEGARALVEKAVQIIEDADTSDREKLQKAKMRADVRLWTAERQGREEFGAKQPGVQVNLNLGDLHLDALRKTTTAVIAVPVETPALPAGEVEHELMD